MTEEFAMQGLDEIARLFPRTWSDTAVALVLDDLLPLPDQALLRAHKRFAIEFPPHITPPIKRVVDVVIEEARKISSEQSVKREQAWSAEKAAERDDSRNFFNAATSRKHGCEALSVILQRVSGGLSDIAVEKETTRLREQYPGAGW